MSKLIIMALRLWRQTRKEIQSYPPSVRQEIGFTLGRVQRGLEPFDWKSMLGLGADVKEIRIHGINEYRVIYVAKFEEAVYLLHTFVKKTQKT